MAFKLTSSATKKALEKQKNGRGSGLRELKIGDKKQVRILVLPPVDENESVFGTNQQHFHWDNKNNKVAAASASPFAFDEKDELAIVGFKLKAKYKESENLHKKDLYKLFIPRKLFYVNCLDLDDIDGGVYQMQLPQDAVELLFEEIEANGDDLTSICDFDQGRALIIRSNQKPGLLRKYRIKFSDNPVELDLTDKEKEVIEKTIFPLSKVQRKFIETEYEELKVFLKKKAEKVGVNIDDLLSSDEESDDDDSFIEDDVEESEIEDYEDNPSKKSSKNKSSKKSSRDSDDDDDDDEFEEAPRRSSKKSSKPSKSKRDIEEDEDEEFESEIDDEDFGDDD